MSTKFHGSTQKTIDALQCFCSHETEKLKLIIGQQMKATPTI